jgi:hypothetical protein
MLPLAPNRYFLSAVFQCVIYNAKTKSLNGHNPQNQSKMKKLYLILSFLALLSVTESKAQFYSQGDLSLMPQPSMYHDSTICASLINLVYVITIQNSLMGDSVSLIDQNSASLMISQVNTTGQNPWMVTLPVMLYTPYVPDDQLLSGLAMFAGPDVKAICGPDTIYNIPNFYSLPVTDPCNYGPVEGRIYVDNNNDCSFNSGDVPLNAIQVTSASALSSPSIPSTTNYGMSDMTGMYNMNIQESWMTSYTVALPSNYQFIFPLSSCAPASYTYATLPQTGVDFPLQCTSSVDVQCGSGSPSNVRPNMPFMLSPYVSNTGCDIASGTLTLVLDNNVTYNASLSANPATTVSGNTLSWNFSQLTNLTNGAYWNSFMAGVHLTPNSSVNIGDTLCFTVTATTPANDVNAANNSYSFCLPVVNSYDPNMKEVSPKGSGPNGNIPGSTSELSYTIHFQNTGTAVAFNVSIVDTLDGDIQQGSLKILGTSHNAYPEWLSPNVVKFNFYNIMLPDSNSDEAASHGDVKFSVKLKSGLALGTQIRNTARIYFDSNPAIVTNTAVNTLANLTGIGELAGSFGDLQLYPNPATSAITVDASAIKDVKGSKLSVLSLNGQMIMNMTLGNNKTDLNISRLVPGVYILKLVNDNNTVIRKFVKE